MGKRPDECTQLMLPPCAESCVGCGFSAGEVEIRKHLIHNGGMKLKDGVYRLILKGKKPE